MSSTISSILRRSNAASALRSLNARNRRSRYSRSMSARSKSYRRSSIRSSGTRSLGRKFYRKRAKTYYRKYRKYRRGMRRGFSYSDSKIKLLKTGSASWLEYYKDQHADATVFENLITWASWRSPQKILNGCASLVAGRPYAKYISLSEGDKTLSRRLYEVLCVRVCKKHADFMTPGYYQQEQMEKQATREVLKEVVKHAVEARVNAEVDKMKEIPSDGVGLSLHSSDSYQALQRILALTRAAKRSHEMDYTSTPGAPMMRTSELLGA